MKFLVFAVSALAVVLGQSRSPTSVCTPDIYQTDIFDFQKNVYGFHAVDWTRNLSVAIFNDTNIRLIYEMTNMTAFIIRPNGSCTPIPLNPLLMTIRCIPGDAVNRWLNKTKKIGRADASGIQILSFDVPITCHSNVTAYFTNTNPAYPFLRELSGGGPQLSGSVILFLNPVMTTVPSPSLTIPSQCRRPSG